MKSKIVSNRLKLLATTQSAKISQMMNSLVVWSGFSKAASGCFERAFKSKQYQDVTLISEDCQEFGAHKMILSSSSEKFRKILQLKSQDRNSSIFLRGVTSSQLVNLLHFIYEGKVEVAHEALDTFIKLVTEFEIEGLRENNSGDDIEMKTELKSTDISMTGEQTVELSVHKETSNVEEDEYQKDVMEETIIENKEDEYEEDVMQVTVIEKKENISTIQTFTSQNSYFESSEFLESSQKQQDGLHHCMKCVYKTKRMESLRTHMSSTHDGPKFICHIETCRRVYSSQANLRSHMKSCHNCDTCEETFGSNTEVKKHKRIVHKSIF